MRSLLFGLALASLSFTGCGTQESASSHLAAAPDCALASWVQGQNYKAGAIVSHEGKMYVATHENPGYSPVISTWYWRLLTWQQGQDYPEQSLVEYGGRLYQATHANPGYDPTISTWYWSETRAWEQGQHYPQGKVVTYQGKIYQATHENPGYDPVISTWYWQEIGGCASQQGPSVPSDNDGFRSILSEASFHTLFPNRLPFYSYEGLASAIDSYPGFAKEGSLDVRKREVAAFLANITHESGHLQYVEESNRANWPHYCQSNHPTFPCAPGKQYYGRGPIQISWNYNYGAASQAIGVDILANPDLVAQDSKIAWQTAIWFWMTQTGAGSMTSHQAIVSGAGFGETIRTINGSLECNGRNPAQVQTRIDYFQNITRTLGVSTGDRVGC